MHNHAYSGTIPPGEQFHALRTALWLKLVHATRESDTVTEQLLIDILWDAHCNLFHRGGPAPTEQECGEFMVECRKSVQLSSETMDAVLIQGGKFHGLGLSGL